MSKILTGDGLLIEASTIINQNDGIESGDSTKKFLEWNNSTNIYEAKTVTDFKTALAISEGASIIDITYTDLMTAISGSLLVAGQLYKITDYQTVHQIPNTTDINTGEIEPLIVTAISANELAPIAYSTLFPDDIIYYNPVNDTNRITGSTKGFIYRRIDTIQNNDIPFDFRQVKFRRWQISQPTWDGVTTYAKGTVVKNPTNNTLWISIYSENLNNEVTTDYWRQFEWDNLSYVSWNADTWTIQDDAFQIILTCTSQYQDYHMFSDSAYYETAYSNTIDMSSGNIIEGNNSVIYGSNFNYNSIGTSFYYNSIGSDFNSNSIGSNFYYNSIGSSFYYNSIGTSFNYNSIGSNFYYNSIGSNFNSNSIGSNFNYNSIGTSFYYNSIGNNITYFSCLLSNIQMNTFEDNNSFTDIDFSLATHIVGAYNCRVYKDKTDGIKLSYVDSGVITVVNVNA